MELEKEYATVGKAKDVEAAVMGIRESLRLGLALW
jgi:hypothetical protein